MTVDMPSSVVPQRRFPEFHNAGDWHYKPLREIAALIPDKVGTSKCVPMSVTTGVGLVSQKEKFGRTIAGSSYKNYIRLQNNDFAYNKSATIEFPQGYIARYSGSKNAAVPNSIFTCFKPDIATVIPEFLDHLFHGNHHGRWLQKYITVGARAHGALSVNDDDLMLMPVPLPPEVVSLPEQQKIADCLGSLDDLIAAEDRKLEALRQHKQGLMQQIFPRPGETQPQPGRRIDWKSFDLPDRVFFQEGPGIMAVDFRDDGVPLVRLSGLSEPTVTLDGCNYLSPEKVADKWEHFRLVEGDLLVSASASFGRPAIVTEVAAGAVFYTGLIRFRPLDDCLSAAFLRAYLDSPSFMRQATAFAVGGGIKHFGPSHLRQMQIQVPPDEEQERVADLFSSIDEVLVSQSCRVDALINHKQGLLQQIFPNPEAR